MKRFINAVYSRLYRKIKTVLAGTLVGFEIDKASGENLGTSIEKINKSGRFRQKWNRRFAEIQEIKH